MLEANPSSGAVIFHEAARKKVPLNVILRAGGSRRLPTGYAKLRRVAHAQTRVNRARRLLSSETFSGSR